MSVRNRAAHWAADAEAKAREAQRALDDHDSVNQPAQWGEIDMARLRSELVAARDEYVREAAHWRSQLDRQRAS